jgi:hypothetical protein
MAERWIITPTGGAPIVLPHTPQLGGCIVTEVQTPAPAQRMQWAQRREGAAATVREYDNRDVTLKVQLFRPTDEWWGFTHDFASGTVIDHAPETEGDGDLPGWTGTVRRAAGDGNPITPGIADLTAVVAATAAHGGVLRRVLADGTAMTFDVVSAEMSDPPAWNLAFYIARSTTLTLRLTCAPFARGDEVKVGTKQKPAGQRFAVLDQLQVPGDVPAAARIELMQDNADQRGLNYFLLAELRPGVSRDQARAEVATIGRQLARANPAHYRDVHLDMQDGMTNNVNWQVMLPGLLLFLGAGAMVFLIACGNVANLMQMRATERRRDIAVRASLGAGRGRLVRQALVECLLIAAAATALTAFLA